MIRVFEAIKSAWDAADLDDTFTGGLWGQTVRAPAATDFPYVRLVSLGKSPEAWTSHSQFSDAGVQFSIFYKENGSTDPLTALRQLAETLKGVFSDDDSASPSLAFPSAAGEYIHMRLANEDFMEEEDGIWHYWVEFAVHLRQDR